jgi:hypothetical protein
MLLLPLPLCSALDNGLALTPPLGWRSFVSSAPCSHVMCACMCVRACVLRCGVRRRAREWYFVCRATRPPLDQADYRLLVAERVLGNRKPGQDGEHYGR